MATEIELKAHVHDAEGLKKILFSSGIFERAYKKEDSYWVSPGERLLNELRIRKDREIEDGISKDERLIVTYKAKRLENGIEINDEREFLIDNVEAFEELLRRLGFTPGIKKRKEGWAFRFPGTSTREIPVTAELCKVEGLGWFIELEIIADGENRKIIESGRKRLLSLLKSLGIGEEQIEERYYSDMLMEYNKDILFQEVRV
ncbi:MAG: class IV adenylate cyclase [Treponema sp.]|jgi:predicted adenylyl cyclase CyaB|nr:class IV adenylate cyclase [Treponema sp.]